MRNTLIFYAAIFTAVFSLFSISAGRVSAQVKIDGYVRSAENNAAVADVNVILQTKNGKSTLAYADTDANGRFSLQYNGHLDSLRIAVTGMNIKTSHRLIPAKSFSNLIIKVPFSSLKIKEVVVKARPIRRRGDTLTYIVSSYMDSIDRTVADVLKKMPGISVNDNSGKVSYNGKDVDYFYIEGLDMLGQGYGLATKNVRAKDIAAVDVMEFHQPVKSLRNKVLSDALAMNLRLKEKSKGTFSDIIEMGAGYKPAMWRGKAVAQLYGKKFQTMDMYACNNTGDNLSGEMSEGGAAMQEYTGMVTPSFPPLSTNRFLKNNIHYVTLNALKKINDSLIVKANVSYAHDIRNSNSTSTTTYYFQDQEPLVIAEKIAAHTVVNSAYAKASVVSNGSAHYLGNALSYSSRWENGRGIANDVSQKYSVTPNASISDFFTYIKPVGNNSLNATLRSSFSSLRSDLIVSPCIYPQIFSYPDSPAFDARQSMRTNDFSASASASYYFGSLRWKTGGVLSADFSSENLKSYLNPLENGDPVATADSLNNNMFWRDLKISIGPVFKYIIAESFSLSVSPKVVFRHISYGERHKDDDNTTLNKYSFSPSANLAYVISDNLRMNASYLYTEGYGSLYNVFGGYIMSTYRYFYANSGLLPKNRRHSCVLDFSYGNALVAMFGGLTASYWHNNSNVMYGTDFYGYLSKTISLELQNSSYGYNVNANLSKTISAINTTLKLDGSYSKSWGNSLRNNALLKIQYSGFSSSFMTSSNIGRHVRFDYQINYSLFKSKIEHSENKLNNIRTLRQSAVLNFVFAKRLVLKLKGDHYYNNSITSGDKNMFFADASISYKTRKIEYILEGNNLLYTKAYNSRSYKDITEYAYAYDLRPLSVMFTVRFSL